MLRKFVAAVFAAALTFGAAQAQDTPSSTRALDIRGYEHDGQSRFVGVYQPSTYRRGQPAPLIAAGAWVFGRWVFPREIKAREAAGGLASVLNDNVAGIRQIKSYTLEDDKQRDFEETSAKFKNMQTGLTTWQIDES